MTGSIEHISFGQQFNPNPKSRPCTSCGEAWTLSHTCGIDAMFKRIEAANENYLNGWMSYAEYENSVKLVLAQIYARECPGCGQRFGD